MTLDRYTCDHLRKWCDKRYRQSYEAACALETYLNEMNEEDRQYALNQGWSWVAAQYESEYPEHVAGFND